MSDMSFGDAAALAAAEERSRGRRAVGIAALMSLLVCWGVVPVLLRDLAGSIDAWTANGIRYPLSAILYWPILWIRRDRINKSLIMACLIPALLSTLGQVFWALSYYYLQASQVAFMVRATTIVSIIAAMILFADERRLLKNLRFYFGLMAAIGGYVAIGLCGDASVVDGNGRGVAIMAICSLFFGLYVVSIRRFLPDVDAILAFAIVAQFCSIGLIVAMLVNGNVAIVYDLTVRDWILIVTSSILGIGLGHMFMYAAVQRLGAAVTTTCQAAMPFLTAVVAGFVLGEELTLAQWIAGVVVVVGALLLLSIKNRLVSS